MKEELSYCTNNLCSCRSVLLSVIHSHECELHRLKKIIASLPVNDHAAINFDNLIWKGSERALKTFFDLLKFHFLISADFKWESFKIHFTAGEICNEQIPWTGAINELVCLFANLRANENLIEIHPAPHIQLKQHFKRFSQQLKSNSLRSSLERGIRKQERRDLIEEIIRKVAAENNRQKTVDAIDAE